MKNVTYVIFKQPMAYRKV